MKRLIFSPPGGFWLEPDAVPWVGPGLGPAPGHHPGPGDGCEGVLGASGLRYGALPDGSAWACARGRIGSRTLLDLHLLRYLPASPQSRKEPMREVAGVVLYLRVLPVAG